MIKAYLYLQWQDNLTFVPKQYSPTANYKMIFNSFTSTPNTKPVRKTIYFATLLISLLGISACKKQETDNTPQTAFSVVNASPTVATYDTYLSGTKISSNPLPAGGSVPYAQLVAGNYDLKFTIAGRTDEVFTKAVSLPQNVFQTFFLVGRPTSLEGFMVIDEQLAISTTSAYVRFVNASPDAPALDLFVKSGNSITTNKTFKAVSSFVPVTAGTYTFEVKETSNGTVKSSTESVTLGANIYYTVMVKGLVSPVGTLELPLSTQVIMNR